MIFLGMNCYQIVVVDGKGVERKLTPTGRCSTGFCWGKGGLCAGETAYAILSAVFGRKIAEIYHTAFKWDIISKLPKRFKLTEEEIRKWYAKTSRTEKRKWKLLSQ